jgi:hypothetical protein
MSAITSTSSPASLDGIPRELPLPEPTRLQAIRQRYGSTLFLIADVGIFLILWQLIQGGAHPIVDPRWIPAPLDIANAFVKNLMNGQFWKHGSFSHGFVPGLDPHRAGCARFVRLDGL